MINESSLEISSNNPISLDTITVNPIVKKSETNTNIEEYLEKKLNSILPVSKMMNYIAIICFIAIITVIVDILLFKIILDNSNKDNAKGQLTIGIIILLVLLGFIGYIMYYLYDAEEMILYVITCVILGIIYLILLYIIRDKFSKVLNSATQL